MIGSTATPIAARPQNAVSNKPKSNTGSVDITMIYDIAVSSVIPSGTLGRIRTI